MRGPCCCEILVTFQDIAAERSMPVEINAGGALVNQRLIIMQGITSLPCFRTYMGGWCSDSASMERMNKHFILECTGDCNRHLAVVTWTKK